MNYPILILCLVLLIGVTLSVTKDQEEIRALNYVDKNLFGGCLNLVIFLGGLGSTVYHLIHLSISDHWWYFLMFFPLYFIAEIITKIIIVIFRLDNVSSPGYDDGTTRLGVRRQLGAIIIIIAYIVFYFVVD